MAHFQKKCEVVLEVANLTTRLLGCSGLLLRCSGWLLCSC